MHHGKHVLCEKPLTHDIYESRALRELAKKQGVAAAMGNQGTASGQFRRGVELIRNGALGEIKKELSQGVGRGQNLRGVATGEAKGQKPAPA